MAGYFIDFTNRWSQKFRCFVIHMGVFKNLDQEVCSELTLSSFFTSLYSWFDLDLAHPQYPWFLLLFLTEYLQSWWAKVGLDKSEWKLFIFYLLADIFEVVRVFCLFNVSFVWRERMCSIKSWFCSFQKVTFLSSSYRHPIYMPECWGQNKMFLVSRSPSQGYFQL